MGLHRCINDGYHEAKTDHLGDKYILVLPSFLIGRYKNPSPDEIKNSTQTGDWYVYVCDSCGLLFTDK